MRVGQSKEAGLSILYPVPTPSHIVLLLPGQTPIFQIRAERHFAHHVQSRYILGLCFLFIGTLWRRVCGNQYQCQRIERRQRGSCAAPFVLDAEWHYFVALRFYIDQDAFVCLRRATTYCFVLYFLAMLQLVCNLDLFLFRAHCVFVQFVHGHRA